jgi:putative heme-binding domain-containing protein
MLVARAVRTAISRVCAPNPAVKTFPFVLVASLFLVRAVAETPGATLPEGYTLDVAAAPPLVRHPIMGCIDDQGRLYVGDAAGLNLKKGELEKQLPNRLLQLTDTKGDGHYDRVTVFADKMTFPQGGCWLNGSLYVASPPGIWKLTDTHGDGVADKREMIVGGFDYTGNAADVHGPVYNPRNGRLYWCHGRKGHKVVQKDGTVVHEGLASGIWSCNPDGTDIQWHALASADNPVRIVFTPDGDLIGDVNLFYSQPRGDVLIHWLYGGVYPRPDMLQAIAGLPRTVDLPVIHNFGHVAVAGMCLLQSGGLNPAWKGQIFITHFNTQRVARMELIPDGATYRTREHEFFKLNQPDAHLTDVIEDRDGSLLVLDTGGWFRIGCPSSLTAKPEIMGAIYRIKGPNNTKRQPVPTAIAKATPRSEDELLVALAGHSPKARLAACDEISQRRMDSPTIERELLAMLGEPLEPALEHGAMFAALRIGLPVLANLRGTENPLLARRLVLLSDQGTKDPVDPKEIVAQASHYFSSTDRDLVAAAITVVARQPESAVLVHDHLERWLQNKELEPVQLQVLEAVVGPQLANPAAQDILTKMLGHTSLSVRQVAWQAVAQQTGVANNPAWIPLLKAQLSSAAPGDLPAVLAAVKKLRNPQFHDALETLAKDEKQSLTARLRALDAMAGGQKLAPESFTLLLKTLQDPAAPTSAQIQASTMLGAAPLTRDEQLELAPQFASLGPIQLREAIHAVNKTKDAEVGKVFAQALVNSPVLASVQESTFRTLFQSYPPEIFEQTLLPALHRAEDAVEAKRRRLVPLSEKVVAQGKPENGRKLFETGRGSCIACHQIGNVGRSIGPNLSHIGSIRREIDILESIIFPRATIARDYEAHSIECAGGETFVGIIKSHTAEGILLVDLGGQEHNIRHDQITADTQLPTSLMPVGLDQTLSEADLVDLVAFIRSNK